MRPGTQKAQKWFNLDWRDKDLGQLINFEIGFIAELYDTKVCPQILNNTNLLGMKAVILIFRI